MVKQISDNEIYLLIKYIKSVLWRVVKRLSFIDEARCLKVNVLGSKPQFFSCPACVLLIVLAPSSLAMYFLLFGYRSCITGYICMS